ncbi:autotransporter domain-containing protein [Sutterella faecalis]|uniref:Autotransporter domain-containing protein n=2 Tax=Sutterella TaxID=40544 RepID=A0AAI9WNN1_9BURK|nr:MULTISPECIES: autotransporter domain-containing protein [Sutterella]KAB7651896.1 autotransporter domain-containing protein [Sutterella seckii]QDA54205.1 autotransporter domain-containing protein [Sutterella faecalis]
MNKTFKVARSLTRGTVVTSEKASSYQGKAVKTVVAAAVAAVMAGVAGSAMAADAYVGEGANITVTENAAGDAAETTVSKVFTADAEGKATTTEFKAADLLPGSTVYLHNGALNFTATDKVAAEETVKDVNGYGSINFTAVNGATPHDAKLTVTGADDAAATVIGDEGDLTISFKNTGSGAQKGTSTLTSSDAQGLTLGVSKPVDHHQAGTVTLDVADGAQAVVEASSGALTLENVVFKNAGDLSLTGTTVALNSAYEGTGGKLTVKATDATDSIAINKAFSDKVVYVGTDPKDIKDVTAQLNGTVTVGKDASFSAETLYVADKNLTLNADGAATTANLTGAGKVTVGAEATLTATTLNLKASTGGLSVQTDGTASGDAIVATGADNVIENAGTIAYKTITVKGTTDAATGLKLSGVSGTLTAETLTIGGPASGSKGTFELAATEPGKDKNGNQLYNLNVQTLDVQDYGVATLTSGNAKVTGDMTVAGKANVSVVNAELVVNNGLVLASGSTVANDGAVTVGYLDNKTALTGAGALTITGVEGKTSTNAATASIAAGSVTVKGDFVNSKAGTGDTYTKNFTADTLNVEGASFKNEGSLSVKTLTLTKGAVYTSGLETGKADTTVEAGGSGITVDASTFNVTALNSAKKADATTNDLLTLDEAWTLQNGGKITVAGSEDPVDAKLTSTLTLNKTTQNFRSLEVSGTGASLTLTNEASSEIGTLTLTEGTVAVNDGTLKVTDKLYTVAGQNFTVGDEGELLVSASVLGLTVKADNSYEFTAASDGKKFNGVTTNDGSIVVEGVTGEVTSANLGTLATTLGQTSSATGLLDLSGLTVKGVAATNNEIAYKTLTDNNLNGGVVLDYLKNVTVTGVNANLRGEFGKAVLEKATTATLQVDNTLVLNGSGDLVQSVDANDNKKLAGVTLGAGGFFVTTGEGAVIGAVTSSDSSNLGEVYVASGDLTVQGNVTADLDVDGKLTVNGDVDAGTIYVEKGSFQTGTVDVDGYKTPGNVKTNLLQIADTGSFTADGKVTLGTPAQADETSYVYGNASIAELDTGTQTLYVGSSSAEESESGHLVVGKLTGTSKIFADPAWQEGSVLALDAASTVVVGEVASGASVQAGQGSIVAIGATATADEAAQLFAQTGYGLGDRTVEANKGKDLVKAVLYVSNETVDAEGKVSYVTATGNLSATGATTYSAVSAVNIGANTMLVMDANKVDTTGATAVFEKDITFNKNAELYVANLSAHDQIKVGKLVSGAEDFAERVEDLTFTGDVLMDAALTVDTTTNVGTIGVTMTTDEELAARGYEDIVGMNVAQAMYDQNKNLGTSSSVEFNNWLYTSTNGLGTPKAVRTAAKEVAGLGATTGVQTLTMDAVNQMADTVADRTSILAQRGQGVNVWADVNGGKFEAKTLFDGAGYSSDIYSGVLGLDYQFSCNAVLGAALTIGTADTDSKNSGVAASTDSDLVGFSVYASKTFADIWNVSADIGYLQASNDVTANGYAHAWKFSEDTDAWTVGVRGEVLTKAGSVNIVPHLGLRYTAISTDGFEAGYVTDIDDQNVFQMPVGVTVSADFETNGWTIAPKFDLSVVPTFGDKDADLKLGITGVSATDDYAVRVIDSNPVQAQFGVNATNGAWGFGLSYKLGAGSDDRMNNSFNANVRYAF